MKLTTDKLTCTVDGKHLCVMVNTIPQNPDPSLQRLYRDWAAAGILHAWRQDDGSFDTDSQAGCQRYVATKSARQVGFALRRLGFSTKQTRQVFRAMR